MEEQNKTFIRNGAIFLAILVVVFFLFNILYFNMFTIKKQLYRNQLEFDSYVKDNNITRISALFVGSSHTKDGANPHFFNNSFNIATGGEGTYILGYYKVRNILDKGVAVDNVIVEIDPHVLNDRVYPKPVTVENLWYWSKLFSYSESKDFTRLSYPDYLAQSNFYFMNGAKDFDIFFHGGAVSNTYHGWVPNLNNLSNEPNIDDYIYQYFKVTFRNTNENLNPLGSEYLLKIADLSKKNNITLTLLKYPLPKGYIDVLSENGFNQSEYYDNIYSLLDEHNVSYNVLDYQNIYNSTSFFGDPGHLNEATSKEFTTRLAKDVARLNGKTQTINK